MGKHYFLPFPQFAGGMNVIDSNDFSTYHALQLQIERRLSAGLTFQAGYTSAKSLDTRSFDPAFTVVGSGGAQSAGSTPAETSTGGATTHCRISTGRMRSRRTGCMSFPSGGQGVRLGASPVLERLIGGWQIAGFGTISGGRPFRCTPVYDVQLGGAVVCELPGVLQAGGERV